MRALEFKKIPFRPVQRENGLVVPFSGYFFWERVKNKNAQEEPVRQLVLHTLVTEYGFPAEEVHEGGLIEIEQEVRFGSEQNRAFADIVIKNSRRHPYIFIECAEPNTSIESKWNQMKGNVSAEWSVIFGGISNGRELHWYKKSHNPREVVPVDDIARYSGTSYGKGDVSQDLIAPVPSGGELKTGLTPFSTTTFRSVLGNERDGLHKTLWSEDGLNPDDCVDELVKLLYVKEYDERKTVEEAKRTNIPQSFIFNAERFKEDPDQLASNVISAFEEAVKADKDKMIQLGRADGSRLVYENEHISLKPSTIYKVVRQLAPYSILETPSDLRGRVFEKYLSTTFRKGLGQYFTPEPVVRLMIGLLAPNETDYIGDPFCGSGRMLTMALEYVRARRTGIAKPEDMHGFATTHLFGVDISRKLVRIAQQNARLHDDEFIDARQNDSLTNIQQLGDMPRAHGFRPGGLTAIATNPPFGAPIKDEHTLELFRITRRQRGGRVTTVKSEEKQVLAIDRCLDMLASEVTLPSGKVIGGRMAIILPDGVLANSNTRVIRNWYRENAILRAVVSLPAHTFMPFGAGVKASVALFEKKTPQWDDSQDYDVYMARVDDIGYDAKGSDHNCPKCVARRIDADDENKFWTMKAKDEIDEIIEDFHAQMDLGWRLT
ncbi:MAG: restriction endonuclease subunit M [Acidobacteria bacterium]|nr:restriction endonuclease subunit M [Acidobacteriota bacterium]